MVRGSEAGPGDGADAIWGDDVVEDLRLLHHRCESVEIGVIEAPAVGVDDGGSLPDEARLAWLQSDGFAQSEDRLATLLGKLVDKLDADRVSAVVPDLGLNEDAVASLVVPDMYAKGFDAYVVCLDKGDRTEDTKGL